eukprot:m.219147 g.219147  ORF g.219147 m.219147 type:complete len:480 (+) comp15109_c0_seq3:1161-2600(+)
MSTCTVIIRSYAVVLRIRSFSPYCSTSTRNRTTSVHASPSHLHHTNAYADTHQAEEVGVDPSLIPDLGYRQNGYLFLASTEAGEDQLRQNVAMQNSLGATWIELLNQQQLAATFPWLTVDDIRVGSYGHKYEGYFDPWALISILRKIASKLGVTLCKAQAKALGISSLQGNDNITRHGAGATHAVDCVITQDVADMAAQQNVVHCDTVVNAAGAFSNTILTASFPSTDLVHFLKHPILSTPAHVTPQRPSHVIDDVFGDVTTGESDIKGNIGSGAVGAISQSVSLASPTPPTPPTSVAHGGITQLPVRPRKRFVYHFKCGHPTKPVPHNSPLTVDPTGAYFRTEGAAFICGISPDARNDPDCSSNAELEKLDDETFEDVIWPTLYERVPAFEMLKLQHSWAGFYEYNTFDQNALIGRHPDIHNMVLCTGFSGHGLQQSPAAGRAVAELIVDGGFTSIDLSCFSMQRVLDNKPMFEAGIV